jgi:hypothetical protein
MGIVPTRRRCPVVPEGVGRKGLEDCVMEKDDYSRSVSMEKFIPMPREEIIEAFTRTLDRALELQVTKKEGAMVSFNVGLGENPTCVIGTALRLDTPSYMTLISNMLSIPLMHGEISSAEAALVPIAAVEMARIHGAKV